MAGYLPPGYRRLDLGGTAMIRVLLWDIDNTLLDFPAAERLALQAAFRDFALGPCPEDRVARYAALNAGYWRQLERGEITKAELLTQRFQVFFQQEGLPCPVVQFVVFALVSAVTLAVMVPTLVKRRASKKPPVTNGSQRVQEKKLARSGLGAWLDGVFISETLGAEKPSLDFFQPVLQAIGPWAREEILLIGDSLTSDMAGGNRAGIPCCWYNPQGQPLPGDLDIRYDIRNLNEVREIVAGNR